MFSIYLDANIYIIGLLDPDSNSARVLKAVSDGEVRVIQSDYLYDEVLQWFRVRKGKDHVRRVRTYLLTVPHRDYISRAEWCYFLDELSPLVADKDDLPHVCSYVSGGAEYFVTTNRKLTQMKIRNRVNFISPKDFLSKLGMDCLEAEW
jgi:predicted nucleic acid-binding protein